jgi:hypothetical protein
MEELDNIVFKNELCQTCKRLLRHVFFSTQFQDEGDVVALNMLAAVEDLMLAAELVHCSSHTVHVYQ